MSFDRIGQVSKIDERPMRILKSNPEGINQYSGMGGNATHSDTSSAADRQATRTGSTVESKQKGDRSSFRFTGPKAYQAAWGLHSATHGDGGRTAKVTSIKANSARVEVAHNTAPLTAEERYGKPSPYGDTGFDGGMMG